MAVPSPQSTTVDQVTSEDKDHVAAVVAAQGAGHAAGHDYDEGSPHLRHSTLRSMVETRLRRLVAERLAHVGRCRVLEVGAGHGTFTQCLLDAGATVTVTEASAASVDHLRQTFANIDRVEVVHDESGEQVLASASTWDLAVMTSVLHHIPDYAGFLDRLCALVEPDGAIFTVQDPLYYPRMSRTAHLVERGVYFSWRLTQGDLGRGVRAHLRRRRGEYDDTDPSDLVEYHVVRQGVDERAVAELLGLRFQDVEVFTYWSTQAPLWQWLGERTRLRTQFGVEARGRLRQKRGPLPPAAAINRREIKILNLGCGTRTSAAAVNIDWALPLRLKSSRLGRRIAPLIVTGARRELFDSMAGELIPHDLRRGIPFPDDSADAVYHSHVLEHIDRSAVPGFLAEIRRVLRPGGVLRIVVPDLELLVRDYLGSLEAGLASAEPVAHHDAAVHALLEQSVRRESAGTSQQRPVNRRIENMLLGDARRRGETHQWMWDRVNLAAALEEAGFTGAEVVDFKTSTIPDWSSTGLDQEPDGTEYRPGSLYVEARA